MAKQKQRNFHAIHPIMRKGGVHEKSNGAKRKAAKLATKRWVSESRCGTLIDLFKELPLLGEVTITVLITQAYIV